MVKTPTSTLIAIVVTLAGVLAGCANGVGDEGQPTSDIQVPESVTETSTPDQVPDATFETANLSLSQLIELRQVVEEVITTAKLVAGEDERDLLDQAGIVLKAIQPGVGVHDLVAEKTQDEKVTLAILGGIFSVGAQTVLEIPSPTAAAIVLSAEELGKRIGEWLVLGQLGYGTVTRPDTGAMGIIYKRDLGELWVDFDTYNPVGRVVMYIPLEPRLVSSTGGGNVVLADGVKPVLESVTIAYRLGLESAGDESQEEDTEFSLELLKESRLFSWENFSRTGSSYSISTLGKIQEVVGRVVTITNGGDTLSVYIGEYVRISGLRGVIENPTFDDLKPGVNIQIIFEVLSVEPFSVDVDFVKFIGGSYMNTKKNEPPVHITVPTPQRENRLVAFPDANLEAAIRDTIGKASGDIYESDLCSLRSLNAPDMGISDLSGLEYCVNLNNLYLGNNQIKDISALGNLHSLIEVSLGGNQIEDISPLTTSSVYMKNLWMFNNRISDISSLCKLTQLQWINLGQNQIVDIHVLANLPRLRNLYLWGNQITDISALANLDVLFDLRLGSNRISDISALHPILSGRTRVDLSYNQIVDISPLMSKGLGAGGILILHGNPLNPKSAGQHIYWLRARGVDVQFTPSESQTVEQPDTQPASTPEDDPIVTFPDANLEDSIRRAIVIPSEDVHRRMMGIPSGDIRQSDLKSLIAFRPWRGAADLSGLEYAINLRHLFLRYDSIEDIGVLSNLTNLKELWLEGNHVRSLWPLRSLVNLETLILWDCGIRNLSFLSFHSDLTGLRELDIGNNSISDISPLADLTNLSYLKLSFNAVSDVSALANLINLSYLNISFNQVSDISALVANKGLSAGDIVILRGNPLSPESVNTFIPQLRARGVHVEL